MRFLRQETAINIAFACSLLRPDMVQYIVNANTRDVSALEDEGREDDAFQLAHNKVGEPCSALNNSR